MRSGQPGPRGDQLDAAIRDATRVAGRIAAEPHTRLIPTPLGPWATKMFATITPGSPTQLCGHLKARPRQPHVLPAPACLFCAPCYQRLRHDAPTVTRCHGCHRPDAALRPVVMQEGMLVAVGHLCDDRCLPIECNHVPR